MKLLGNRILVEKEDEAKKSGIILPQSHVEPIFTGTVITVGAGFITTKGELMPCISKPGDKIYYTSTAGWHITYKGKTYTILNERDVLCILDKEEKFEE